MIEAIITLIDVEAKFPLGQVVSTPGALRAFEAAGTEPTEFLKRHMVGDWGEVGSKDKKANDADLKDGGRLLSVYTLKTGVKIWIITEADRSATTFLLPEEY